MMRIKTYKLYIYIKCNALKYFLLSKCFLYTYWSNNRWYSVEKQFFWLLDAKFHTQMYELMFLHIKNKVLCVVSQAMNLLF